MNKRLVWNFEICPASPLPEITPPEDLEDAIRWEARYFCDDHAIFPLHGLDESFLNLARYKIKERSDVYYLLPGENYNIKKRRDEISYKPLFQQTPECQGFGKKILLENSEDRLPGVKKPVSAKDLLQKISEAHAVTVEKTALIYKFGHSLKLELARLTIKDRIYFSACVEGRSHSLVSRLSQKIFPGQNLSGYVEFLKKTVQHHE